MTGLLFKFIALFLSPNDLRLAEHIQANAPRYLTIEQAATHVIAARLAETPEVSAELMLSMAYSESRYNPRSVSRVEDGVRKGNIPKWTKPPANVTGPYFCGVTQVAAQMSWKRCVEFQDIFLAYSTASMELGKWYRDPYCRKAEERIRCALFGYGGGYQAIKSQTSTYPNRVLGRAKRFERMAQGNT